MKASWQAGGGGAGCQPGVQLSATWPLQQESLGSFTGSWALRGRGRERGRQGVLICVFVPVHHGSIRSTM